MGGCPATAAEPDVAEPEAAEPEAAEPEAAEAAEPAELDAAAAANALITANHIVSLFRPRSFLLIH